MARERARLVLNVVMMGEQPGAKRPPRPIASVLPDYLKWSAGHNRRATYRMKAWCAKEIAERFGAVDLGDLTAGAVSQWASDMRARGLGAPTINRHLAVFKHLMTWAEGHQHVSHETAAAVRRVRMMREPAHRVRYLSPDELQRLIAKCKEPLRSIVMLALNTGMRQGEMCALHIGDIDLIARHLHIPDSKTGKARFVPLNDAALKAAKRLIGRRKDSRAPLLVCQDGRKRMTQWGLVSAWRRARKATGIGNLRFHDTRHHFASMLAQQGVSMAVIASLLGHSKGTGLQMTLRYAHLADAALRQAVDKLR